MRRHTAWSPTRRRSTPKGLLARLRPSADDSGISLVELMVSLVIFGLAASALAAGFIASIKTSGSDRNRLAAANLAQREVEIVRNAFTASETGPQNVITAGNATNPNPLPGGTAGQPLVVDGRPYTVVRTLNWLPSDVGSSACDGGSALTYPKLALGVKVSWPGIGEVTQPVETNTILTPPRGVINSSISFVAVKVTRASGSAYEDMDVTLRRTAGGTSSARTQADGCAVFGTTQTGAHTVVLDKADHVDLGGVQLSSRAINITSSSFQRIDLSYDEEARFITRFQALDGYPIPAGVTSVSLGSSVLPSTMKPFAIARTGPTTIENLWPASDGYAVWAGTCDMSDPPQSGGTRSAVYIAPGGTGPEKVALLAPVTVNVVSAGGAAIAGRTVIAQPVAEDFCSTGERNLTLGVSDATGTVKASLPGGTWRLTISGRAAPTDGWPTTDPLLPSETVTTYQVVTT